jgi:phosphotransferase system HPr (HPr) family protein
VNWLGRSLDGLRDENDPYRRQRTDPLSADSKRPRDMSQVTAQRTVIVCNPQGFHARPAHLFVKLAMQFQAEVRIAKGNEVINGKSILDLLTLGAGSGTELRLEATGDDASAALEALAKLIEDGFGEGGPSTEAGKP